MIKFIRSLVTIGFVSVIAEETHAQGLFPNKPQMGISLEDYDLACSEPKSEIGTEIKGLNVNLGVCNAVSQLTERGYSCQVNVEGTGPFCGSSPQYQLVQFSRHVNSSNIICESPKEGVIELRTKLFRKRIHEDKSHISGGGCARPKITQTHMRKFADEKIMELLGGQIKEIFFSCEVLNSCTISELEFARFLADNLDGSKFWQGDYHIVGSSKFGEEFSIYSSKNLSIARGDIEKYRKGGISLE